MVVVRQIRPLQKKINENIDEVVSFLVKLGFKPNVTTVTSKGKKVVMLEITGYDKGMKPKYNIQNIVNAFKNFGF